MLGVGDVPQRVTAITITRLRTRRSRRHPCSRWVICTRRQSRPKAVFSKLNALAVQVPRPYQHPT
jgi:hypothetical protein